MFDLRFSCVGLLLVVWSSNGLVFGVLVMLIFELDSGSQSSFWVRCVWFFFVLDWSSIDLLVVL
jgi:hypothetical protein